jgi:hypothetical protein
MPDPNVSEIVRETLSELKKQSLSEKIKGAFMTMFATAVGALITVLLLSQWNEMAQEAQTAKNNVLSIEQKYDSKLKTVDAQFGVIIDKIAKLETSKTESPTIPAMEESPDSLQSWEQSKEKIQKQIDKEVYRAEKR